MSRYRLVTQQDDGAPHVSVRVIGESEIEWELDAEAVIHQLGGWKIERSERTLICRKGGIIRTIIAKETTPMEDDLE